MIATSLGVYISEVGFLNYMPYVVKNSKVSYISIALVSSWCVSNITLVQYDPLVKVSPL